MNYPLTRAALTAYHDAQAEYKRYCRAYGGSLFADLSAKAWRQEFSELDFDVREAFWKDSKESLTRHACLAMRVEQIDALVGGPR